MGKSTHCSTKLLAVFFFFLNGEADHPNNHKMAQLDRVHARNIPDENQINLKIKSEIFCAVICSPIFLLMHSCFYVI